jgi:phage terminase large subunit-like protein
MRVALDNQATPKYYAEFRQKVLNREIPVNREISLEMNRIDALIENPLYYYDEKAVEGFIKYCENELTLTDGSDLYLLDTFKLWAEQIFCWYYYVERDVYVPGAEGQPARYVKKTIKKRLTTKQYLIVARGAAKSMYAFCIQAYFLNVDTSTTHGVQTAPTMKLADEVMAPFRTSIIRSRGPLFKFLTDGSIHATSNPSQRQKLASTKKGIENLLTGSYVEVRPMAINKLQGLRSKVNTIDEWLSGDLREDVVGAIEQGASKLENYLIVAISSEGTVRNGSGDTIKMELADILKGDYLAPHVSIWHYKLDDVEEVGQPETWLKANPNLGKTVTYDVYHLDVKERRKRQQQETTFWQNALVSQWRGIRTTSLMRTPSHIPGEISGRCRVRLAPTFHKATTSAHSRFSFLFLMVHSGLRPAATSRT